MRFFAWLRSWIRTAIAASSRKEFYRRIEDRKLGETIGHLALLAVFLWAVPFLIAFFVGARYAAQAVTEGLRTRVAPGTVFEMKNGVLTSTLSEPLVFEHKGAKLIVNSTTSTLGLQNGANGLVVSATGISHRTIDGIQTVSFKDAPDFRWTREEMLHSIARWTPLALFLGALLLGLVASVMTWIGFLISAAIHALVLLLALHIVKRPWPWRRTFIASAYAGTGPIVLSALMNVTGLRLGFVAGLLYWLILLWIAYDAVKRQPPVVTQEPNLPSS